MATFDLFKVVAYVFDRNMPHLPCLSLSDNLPDIIWGFLRQLAQPGWPAMQCKTNAKNYLQMLFNPGCLPFFFPSGFNNLLPYRHTEGWWNKPRDTLTNTTVRWHKHMSHQHTQKQVYTQTHCPTNEALFECDSEHSVFHYRNEGPTSAASPWGKTGSGIQIAAHNWGIYTPSSIFCHTWLTNTPMHK